MTVSLLRCAVCSVCRNTRRLGLQTTQAYLVITLLKARLLIVGMSAPWEFAKYPSDNWELPTILAWWRRLHFSCHRWRWGGQTGSEKWTSCHATTGLWGTTPTWLGDYWGQRCLWWAGVSAAVSPEETIQCLSSPSLLCLVLLAHRHHRIP